jgi:hypothetical protein
MQLADVMVAEIHDDGSQTTMISTHGVDPALTNIFRDRRMQSPHVAQRIALWDLWFRVSTFGASVSRYIGRCEPRSNHSGVRLPHHYRSDKMRGRRWGRT